MESGAWGGGGGGMGQGKLLGFEVAQPCDIFFFVFSW